MTTPATISAAPNDLSMRELLDQTMQDFGVSVTPLTTPPAVDTKPASAPVVGRTEQIIAVVALVVAITIALLFGRALVTTPTPAQTQPTAAPASIQAPLPTLPPVAMIAAYGAPNEAPRWQIEATRVITPLAHFGSDWLQADVQGSGVIWLKASDWPQLAIIGPDLAPRPTARPAQAPVVPAATPPPPPPPCAEAGVPGKIVEVCDYADLSALQEQAKAKWIETYGGNVGIVATPSPQEWNRP